MLGFASASSRQIAKINNVRNRTYNVVKVIIDPFSAVIGD
jgi:hypothetical protein